MLDLLQDKRLLLFLIDFQIIGMCGLIIASVLFGAITYIVLILLNKYNIDKYENLINNNKIFLMMIKGFAFICFCIMISAIGAYGEQLYNISFWYGSIFASLICFILFLFKFEGLEKINNILVPFILVGILFLGNLGFDNNAIEMQFDYQYKDSYFMNNWLVSTFLYVGYNSILLVPILSELKVYRLKKGHIVLLSLITTLVLAISGLLIYGAINGYYPSIASVELPTLAIAEKSSTFFRNYYSIVMLFAIFTTAFSCGYSFLRMSKEQNYFRNTFLVCVLSVFFSKIGFSNMINLFFPIFGYLGIIQIVVINLKKKVNK